MSPSKNTVPVGRQSPAKLGLKKPATSKYELIVYSTNGNRIIYPLRNEVTTVGRATDNDVVLDDQCVSGHHCEFRKFGEDAFEVIDLESYNGTSVNRIQVERATIKAGDLIALGIVDVVIVPAGKSADDVASEEAEEFRKEQREFAKLNKQLEDDRRKLNKDREALKIAQEGLEKERLQLSKDREGFKDEVQKKKLERAQKEEKIENTKKALKEEQDDFAKRKEGLQKELDELTQTISQREKERDDLAKEIQSSKENIESNKKELGLLATNLATEKAALDSLNSNIAELNGEKARTSKVVDSLKEEVPSLQEKRDRLDAEANDLEQQVAQRQAQVVELEQSAVDAAAAAEASIAEQNKVDQALLKKQDELAFFENRLAITREERDQMEEETREYRIFMSGFERQKAELEQKVWALESRLSQST